MRKPQTLATLAAGLAVLGLALAGCGATSTSSGSINYGPPAATSTTAPAAPSGAVVKTATATITGQSVTILTDANGNTLYYYKLDTATTSACTGGCAAAWPPLLSPGGAPTSSATLPGKLAVLSDANGMQVTYNGHPLYTFTSDTSPGMTSGEGVNNFFVATVTLANLASTGGGGGNATPTPKPTGYGY